jgi:hypothetical protein
MEPERRLSIVVQGPIVRRNGQSAQRCIEDVLNSCRISFPHAELILSTWQGADVDGLDADTIITSPDPGSLIFTFPNGNTASWNSNRMMRSTLAGLAAASQPFCIKTRTDVLFTGPELTGLALSAPGRGLPLESRIHIPTWGTKSVATTLMPFHFSDLVHFGRTHDLLALWSNRLCSWDEAFWRTPSRTGRWNWLKIAPEQVLFAGFFGRIGMPQADGSPLRLEDSITCDPYLIAMSLDLLCAACDLFDERALGVMLPDRIQYSAPPWEMLTVEAFEALRQGWHSSPKATLGKVMRSVCDLWVYYRIAPLTAPKDVPQRVHEGAP